MLDKHSSARSLAFVFSEISTRNCRTLKLLSNPLERDVLVKNSARGLEGSPCLHVNHFQRNQECRELKEVSCVMMIKML